MFQGKVNKMLYGGDYNPEQWPREIWDEDMRLFELAGIDIVSINVFSWAYNQPDEQTYRFDRLDEMMDLLQKNNIWVSLGTSTAAHPAWMAKKYPDVLAVDMDGKKRKFGRRHNSCPNSPTFRKYSVLMARKLAERYKDHPALLMWHVNNEYGLRCYCERCEQQFRLWLKEKYGTLDALNSAWYTAFWGHTFYEWDEIVAPNNLSEHYKLYGVDVTNFSSISLDYARFMSDSVLECYTLERDAIKEVAPDSVVTTNFQSNGTYKPLDYFKWAKEMDVVALDSYPTSDMAMSYTAMRYDLMRGLKQGQPFLLMESTPSALNWKPQNPLKRPGITKLWSYQAVARGADSVMYFQLRRSFGAFEKFHGAMIDHVGHEHTRVFRECAELGHELQHLDDRIVGARVEAKVAILFDWENWWAIEYSSGPTIDLKYLNIVQKYYDALYGQHVQVDFVSVDDDFNRYDIVIAPVLYMVKQGLANKLEQYTAQGGTFVTTFFSGIVNETDLVTLNGYPGELKKLLGIWVEEIDSLMPNQTNSITMTQQLGKLSGTYTSDLLCDLIHSEGAEVIAEYGSEFYKGMAAVTRNKFGQGEAWYVGTNTEDAFIQQLLEHLCEKKEIKAILASVPEQVEVSKRYKGNQSFLFILNHRDEEVTVPLNNIKYTNLLTNETIEQQVLVDGKTVCILEYHEERTD
ncbi:beta-galactosidase [Paenibacillus yanchengensis]|uniref:Beta-galactosidase n=1 Tax=Paenibacillus yanchengensis TaxID=2035833 RepID=A0ABW4YGI2_9BACL